MKSGLGSPPNRSLISDQDGNVTRPWAIWAQQAVDTINYKSAVLDIQQVSSSVSTINLTNGFGTQYKRYTIDLIDVTFSAATSLLQLLVSIDKGATYVTAAASYMWGLQSTLYSAGVSTWANSVSDTALHLTSVNATSTAHNILCGTISIYNPSSGSSYTMLKWDLSYRNATPDVIQVQGTGMYLANTAVNAIRLLPTSGNVASGTIVVTGFN